VTPAIHSGGRCHGSLFSIAPKTLAAGVVLLIVIVVLVGLTGDQFIIFEHAYWTFFVRWLHIMTGIMWMGCSGT
jgi:hypothetical protein